MTSGTRRDIMAGIAAGAGLYTLSSAVAQAQDNALLPLSVYGKLPVIEDIALSPDGSRVAYITSINGDRVIYDRLLADETEKGLLIAKSKLRAVFYADNEHIVTLTSTTEKLREFSGGRDEYSIALVLDVRELRKGKVDKLVKLYDKMPDFYSIVMGDLNRITYKGEPRVTASNIRLENEGTSCLYSFGLNGGQGRLLDETTGHVLDWVVTPDGHAVGRSEFDNRNGNWTLYYNSPNDNKGWRVIYRQTERLDFPNLKGLGRDGVSLVLYVGSGDLGGRHYEISPEGILSEPLETPGSNNTALFHPKTRRLIGFSSTSENRRVFKLYDPVISQLTTVVNEELADYTIRNIVDMAEDPRKMILYLENADSAGSYVFIDFSTGALQVIGDTRPSLPKEWIGEQTRLTYKATDGLEIAAFLTLPPAAALKGREAKNLPLVVMPHGGPQADDGYGFDWMAQALASRGYAVLQPNFRGSSGYGGGFIEAGHGEWGRKMQTDLSDGVRHLAKEGLIDPKRVAIAGASYGGYAALGGAALDVGVYNCAVAIAPVVNLKSFVRWVRYENGLNDKSPAVLYWKRFMGSEDGWDAVSPDVQAAKIQCPVMLIHGRDDVVVPFEQTDLMTKALQKAGKPYELITLKEEDHWLSREPTRLQTLEAMTAFLIKHNPPF